MTPAVLVGDRDAGVGVHVGVGGNGGVDVGTGGVPSTTEVDEACATGVAAGAGCALAVRVMTTGCDCPAIPCALKALTTMTWVPATSLCHCCDTMYGELSSGLVSTRTLMSSTQSSMRWIPSVSTEVELTWIGSPAGAVWLGRGLVRVTLGASGPGVVSCPRRQARLVASKTPATHTMLRILIDDCVI